MANETRLRENLDEAVEDVGSRDYEYELDTYNSGIAVDLMMDGGPVDRVDGRVGKAIMDAGYVIAGTNDYTVDHDPRKPPHTRLFLHEADEFFDIETNEDTDEDIEVLELTREEVRSLTEGETVTMTRENGDRVTFYHARDAIPCVSHQSANSMCWSDLLTGEEERFTWHQFGFAVEMVDALDIEDAQSMLQPQFENAVITTDHRDYDLYVTLCGTDDDPEDVNLPSGWTMEYVDRRHGIKFSRE